MKHLLMVGIGFLWEYWLGKTNKFNSSSTVELIINVILTLFNKLRGEKKMDKDVKLGEVGDLDLSLSEGKAKVSVNVVVSQAALSASVCVVVDATVLIDKLKEAIEKAYPASAPIDEAVFGVLKAAVSKL